MMRDHNALTCRALVAVGAAVGFALSQGALADTASDDLETTAGLTEALTLSCDTALSFGITRLANVVTRTQMSIVTLDPVTGDLTASGGAVQTGQGSAGSCTLSGSAMPRNSGVTVSIDGEDVGGEDLRNVAISLGGDASAFSSLQAPDTPLNLAVGSFAVDNINPMVDRFGKATVAIGAALTIPGTVTAANFGGYSSNITVAFDDGFGDN